MYRTLLPVTAHMKAEYFKSTGYSWVSILLMHQPASGTEKFRNKFEFLLVVRIDLYIYSHKFFTVLLRCILK